MTENEFHNINQIQQDFWTISSNPEINLPFFPWLDTTIHLWNRHKPSLKPSLNITVTLYEIPINQCEFRAYLYVFGIRGTKRLGEASEPIQNIFFFLPHPHSHYMHDICLGYFWDILRYGWDEHQIKLNCGWDSGVSRVFRVTSIFLYLSDRGVLDKTWSVVQGNCIFIWKTWQIGRHTIVQIVV